MVDSKENYNFDVGVKGLIFFLRDAPTDLEYDMFAFQIYTVVINCKKNT